MVRLVNVYVDIGKFDVVCICLFCVDGIVISGCKIWFDEIVFVKVKNVYIVGKDE